MRLKKTGFVWLLVLCGFFCPGNVRAKIKFEKMLSVGGSSRDTVFFDIRGAALVPGKYIFLTDMKGHAAVRLNWKGEIEKKISSRGKGPGDLLFPKQVAIYRDSLLVWDARNQRICEYDFDLNLKSVFKLNRNFFDNFLITDGGAIIGDLLKADEPGRIGVFDSTLKKSRFFFKRLPHDLPKKFKNMVELGLASVHASLCLSLTDQSDEVAVCYRYPDRICPVFLYDLEGNLKKEIRFELSGNYGFPKFLLKYPVKYPHTHQVIRINSMFYFKKTLLLHISFWFYEKGKRKETRSYLYRIDRRGKVTEKISVNKNRVFLNLENEKYLVAKICVDEDEKLEIFEIRDCDSQKLKNCVCQGRSD